MLKQDSWKYDLTLFHHIFFIKMTKLIRKSLISLLQKFRFYFAAKINCDAYVKRSTYI